MNESVRAIGRYQVLERVGRGGMGVLYRGRDPVLDREVAIKVMSEHLGTDEAATERFFREARAAAKLQHRNIVTIFDLAQDGNVPYIVMEFLRGRSLAARLREAPPLTRAEQVGILIQLCAGLHFAHGQGVVHRDVKPGNVWLLPDGTVKLLDFGIAKVATTTLSRGMDIVGSAAYMSPEQIRGRPIDGRADVFSAGIILYELLSGRRPFDGESPTAVMMRIIREEPTPIEQLAPDIPPMLAAAVKRAMTKDAADRYPTAGEFAADLQAANLELQTASAEPEFDLGETYFVPTPAPPAVTPTAALALDHPTRTVTTVPLAPLAPVEQQGAAWWTTVPRAAWIGGGAVLLVVAAIAVMVGRGTTTPAGSNGNQVAAQPEQAAPGRTGATQDAASKAPAVPPAADKTRVSEGTSTPPQSPVDPPAAASVMVSSEPSGAAIAVDGRDLDLVTPAAVRIEGKLPLRVRLSKSGFAPATASITEADVKAQTLMVKLQPADSDGRVQIRGNYAFAVLDERGRTLSPPAKSHAIPVSGRRTVRLSASAYLLNQSVSLESGRAREAPALGTLVVKLGSAVEDCDISIRGRSFTPFEEHRLAAGSYTVDVTCPTGSNRRELVTVQPNRVTSFAIR